MNQPLSGLSRARPLVLDVSLRDGGYLNDWRFSSDEIDTAVAIAAAADADLIEVGYLDDRPGLPEAAACPPATLQRLRGLCEDSLLAAMIRPSVLNPDAVLASRAGLLELLRIPVDLRWPEKAVALAQRCRAHGFAVSFNFTGVTTFSLARIAAVAAEVPDFVTVLYLADSRGKLQPDEIAPLVSAVRGAWQGPIGYHAHDNLGLAKANSERALAAGCEWIDASIAGAGLGGRNLTLGDAIALARPSRPDLEPDSRALTTSEAPLGLPAPGTEMPLYRLTGERNLRMEWVQPLLDCFGFEETTEILSGLPVRNWFDPDELEPYLGRERWERVKW